MPSSHHLLHRFHAARIAAALIAAGLVAAAAADAATPRTGTYAGSTSGQGKTIKLQQDRSLRFSVARGVVRGLKVGFKATCPSGELELGDFGVNGTFKVSGGRFSGTRTVENGGTATVTGRFTSARQATGTIRLRPISEEEGVEGGGPESCDSGALKWSVRLR